ncbi:hypothetical protein OAP24_03205 [Porticoccaceae bacterium]|nr:hypothetical protein [Porticoccaceae bacterium]
MTDHIKPTSAGPVLRMASAIALSLVLGACQMPSYSPPSGSSSPSNPSSSGGGSSGGSTSSPGGSSGGSAGGMPSPGGSQGADSGSSGADSGNSGADSGNSGAESGNSGADSGDKGPDSGSQTGDSSSAGSESGSAGDSLEDLDQALDESLEGFDDNVGGKGSDSAEIDILSPTGGGGGVQSDSEAPLFEEADAMAEANAEIENRAAEGPGADSADSAGTDGAPEGQDQVGEGSPGTADNDLIPIPEDIDDGQGDDIVLRQIRDAAMKEKDPVLREKLWDEYRRIKNQ